MNHDLSTYSTHTKSTLITDVDCFGWSLLREDDGIDDMDETVAALDVPGDHFSVINGQLQSSERGGGQYT